MFLTLYLWLFPFFPIIDLPHLAVEDKRQETSGEDKLPHDLDKREKREKHTNPFRKKRPKDKKREKGDKLLLDTLSLSAD